MYTVDSSLIKNMFDKISSKYDFINDAISFYTHKIIKKISIKELDIKPNSKVLDLCCGSGDLGAIIKEIHPSCDVIGVDFSSKMIELAAKKHPNLTFREMDATHLNFEKNSFDYIVMGFGLRNIPEKNKALDEVRRILKTNGSFLHLDFGKPNLLSKIHDIIILFFAKLLMKDTKPYKYLILSKNRFLSPEELVALFKFNNLYCIKHKNLLFNLISYQIMTKK